jgi:hypothetical protein
MKIIKNKDIVFILWLAIIIVFADIMPKATLILATPFVYKVEIFNNTVTNPKISIFVIDEKIIIRANVSNQGGNAITSVLLNLTAANGTKIINFVNMTGTSITCPGTATCKVWENNYTISIGDPDGIWLVNVTGNDTAQTKATNSTQFTLGLCTPTANQNWNQNCTFRCVKTNSLITVLNMTLFSNGTFIANNYNISMDKFIFDKNFKLILNKSRWVMG